MRFLAPLLALAALAAPAVCNAQAGAPAPQAAPTPASGASGGAVTVTGRRVPEKKVVEHLTRTITRVDADEHIARFPDAVCPMSDGMPLDYDARLAARIRTDAAAAGIPVDKPGCRPNIIVMVVPSGQKMVQEIRRSRSFMFGGIEKTEVDRMAADPGPVHGWTTTELRSRDSDRLREGTMLQDVPEIQVRQASLLLTATRADITASVLLLDQDAVVGKTVNQIADYAAMRTLARLRSKGVSGDTILTLFDARPGDPAAASSAPHGLTAFDAGYLKALYHGPVTEAAPSKVGSIARAINAGAGTAPAGR